MRGIYSSRRIGTQIALSASCSRRAGTAFARTRKSVPGFSIRHDDLLRQCIPDLFLVSVSPHSNAGVAQGPQNLVLLHQFLVRVLVYTLGSSVDDLLPCGCPDRGEDVEFAGEFGAVVVEGEIIDVVSERVLELVSNGHEADDDVCGGDGPGDGDPSESVEELEGQEIDVEVYDLGDEDVVADGERRLENTFGGRGTICEGVHAAEDLTEDDGGFERSVAEGAVDVGVEIGEDFVGEVSNRFAGSLDGFSGVAGGET